MNKLIINAGFSRKVRVPHHKARIQNRGVQGVKVEGLEWGKDDSQIRKQLAKHAPEGEGWALYGYYLVRSSD